MELGGRDRRAAQPGGALDLGEVDAAQVDVLEPSLVDVEPSDRRPARAEAGDGRACEVEVAKDGLNVNAKSIMGVLMLAAEHGSHIQIRCEGHDADEALEAIAALVQRGFEEL